MESSRKIFVVRHVTQYLFDRINKYVQGSSKIEFCIGFSKLKQTYMMNLLDINI